jgi:hypothetical protein
VNLPSRFGSIGPRAAHHIAVAVAIAATIAGTAAIASTFRVFSSTFDEPAHIAAGLEWLSTGEYRLEAQHPPLGRIAAGVGPYLAGERSTGSGDMWSEGRRILGRGEHYRHTLALARWGELPFFLLLCWGTWAWGRRVLPPWGAAAAVVLVASNPTVLAHAGLATTDVGLAATYPVALLATVTWLERRTLLTSAAAGVAISLAILTKFSAIAFLGVALSLTVVAHRLLARRPAADAVPEPSGGSASMLPSIVVGIVAMLIVICAAYRFDVGRVGPLTIPAPQFIRGIQDFLSHGGGGHPSFLFGRVSTTGWWYYFPVAIILKTPLPVLALGTIGLFPVVQRIRRDRDVAAAAVCIGIVAVLLVGMLTGVNIGVRLVLSLFPLLAVVAAAGAVHLWKHRGAGHLAATVLVLSNVVVAARAHPDHLAYFNALAGGHPEEILSDSNLDWGQDLYRLNDVIRSSRVDTLHLAYFGSTSPIAADVPNTVDLLPGQRPRGWIAVSETFLAGVWVDTAYAWLGRREPYGRVGKSIRVYWVPK